MNYLIWASALVGILSTAVILGTDVFFLTIGRPALKMAAVAAATEVMGFLHLYGDARMPIWGILALLSNLLLLVIGSVAGRWFYAVSVLMILSFVLAYNLLSRPINRLQTAAAKSGQVLENGRVLQASWDRSLLLRVPLLLVSLLAQVLALGFAP